jgi:hypothetical protein
LWAGQCCRRADNQTSHPVRQANPFSWPVRERGLAREWGKSRIGWLGVPDWHGLAITEPRALALWWQGVLDTLRIERAEECASRTSR